jgi:hypothetical protein
MLCYIAGLGITQTLLLIWFYSPLKTTITQFFLRKDAVDGELFDTWLLLKSPLVGKLLGCYFCCSFWASLIIGIGSMYCFDLPHFYPFITWLTYPSLTYLYKKIIDL